MSLSLRRAALAGCALSFAPCLHAGEVTAVSEAVGGAAVLPDLSPLEPGTTYAVSFAQSAGDPLLRGVYVPLPAGVGSISVTGVGGGGDIEVDTTALGGTWSVSAAGGAVNLVDAGPGVASGTFEITFANVPPGAELGWGHAAFSGDGALLPGASLLPDAGDELRLPTLVLDRKLNRVQLDNGGDALVALSRPSIGSDPTQGDFSGDLYTKIIPRMMLRHAQGTMDLNAIEYVLFDLDWDQDDADLWAWALTSTVNSSNTGAGGSGLNPGNLEPDFSDPGAVFVPEFPSIGLGNPLGPGVCPPTGEIAGYVITETFTDPVTGEPVPIRTLVADGATDYAFTHFFPGGQDTLSGGVTCGPGNASLSYFLSTDFMNVPFVDYEGENQTDWLGTGYSAYGLDRKASDGPDYRPHGVDETAQVRFYFEEATLQPVVDAGLDGGLLELGLAVLNIPIGLTPGGVATGTSATLAWRIYSEDAAPAVPGTNPNRFGIVFATTSAPLPAPGLPFQGDSLMLNPADPLFLATAMAWGLDFFAGYDTDGDLAVDETYYSSATVNIPVLPVFLGIKLHVQGFDFVSPGSDPEGTQVVTITFRPND